MPRISTRKWLKWQIKKLLENMILFGNDKTSDFTELMDLQAAIESSRFLVSKVRIPKSRALITVLLELDNRQFRQLARMNKSSFIRLVVMLEQLPIYRQSNHPMARNKQKPVWQQVFVGLSVLGCEGNGASNFRIGRIFGDLGHGTVTKYKQTFIDALGYIRKEWIYWPDFEERQEISKRFGDGYGLYDCVFIVDGTYIVFDQKPAINGETFFTRKNNYAMNVPIFCDDLNRIRYLKLGWPGSVGDNDVLENTSICKEPEEYLSPRQYGIADAGYALKWWLCTPYKKPASQIPANKIFNDLFSIGRSKVERCIGGAKGRTRSLRGIRTQIRCKKDFCLVFKHIYACFVLHNIMIEYKDDDFHEAEAEEDDDDDDVVHDESTTGLELRGRVQLNLIQRWYNNI